MGRPPTEASIRFWRLVDTNTPTGCWLWTGSTNEKGYGRFKVAGKNVRAHRFAYELLVEPIPDDLQLDHLCEVKACVNPAHLEVVDNAENTRRRYAGRTVEVS